MELIELPIEPLDPKDVYLSMGTGRSDGNIRPEILEVIEQLRSRAEQLMQIRYLLTLVPIQITGPSQILLDESFLLTCHAKFFEGAS